MDVVPARMLPVFTWRELQQLVCGDRTVDLELLKRCTAYVRGLTPAAPVVRWLWEVLESFSPAERQQLYARARARPPPAALTPLPAAPAACSSCGAARACR